MITLGICMGDVTGIGPEVTLKALGEEFAQAQGGSAGPATRYILIGDEAHTRRLNRQLGLDLPIASMVVEHQENLIQIRQALPQALPENLKPGAPEAARAAYEWLRAGAALCLEGRLAGIVTAPVNKKAIVDAGIPFIGQTELLSELSGTARTAMMLLGKDDRGRWLRVALATTHVSIRKLPDQLTTEKVLLAIELAAQSCRELRLPRQRVAVCGLNPHAGEGGQMGTEEITTIEPAVRSAREHGLDVVGPMSADALFYYAYKGDYDAVVAMYHDQGLAPLKMVAFEHGINWTLGLPFVRTSPDHGTGYDIAGQNKANPSSMRAAIQLARTLAR